MAFFGGGWNLTRRHLRAARSPHYFDSICKFRRPASARAGFAPGARLFMPGDAAVAGPDDGRAAPVHANLAVDGGHVIAHRVARQAQLAGDLVVAMALAQQAQHLALARRQLRQLGHVAGRRRRGAQLRQLLDDAAAEPRCVLHHRLDRGQQFGLAALAFGDVLHHQQHAALAADHDRLGRGQAIQKGAVGRGQRGFAVADALAARQAVGHAFERAQAQGGQFLARAVLRRHAHGLREGVIDIQRAQRFAVAQRHRHRRQPERLGEALLALLQGLLGALALFQVDEGEQHARFVLHVDRLAGDDDEARAAVRQPHHAFALADGQARVQLGHRVLLVIAAVEHVQLVGRFAQHCLARQAGHVQEALVHLHIAQVGQAADERRRGIGGKGALEALLGVELAGLVIQDQHAEVRAVAFEQQAARADVAQEVGVILARQVQQQVVECDRGGQAVERILLGRHAVMVAVGQRIAFAVAGGRLPQRLQRVDPVQRQRAGVGPGDAAIGLEQDDAFVQACDDALQVLAVCVRGGVAGGHVGLLAWLAQAHRMRCEARPVQRINGRDGGRGRHGACCRAKQKSSGIRSFWRAPSGAVQEDSCGTTGLAACWDAHKMLGGADGARTRDPRRDRPVF